MTREEAQAFVSSVVAIRESANVYTPDQHSAGWETVNIEIDNIDQKGDAL